MKILGYRVTSTLLERATLPAQLEVPHAIEWTVTHIGVPPNADYRPPGDPARRGLGRLHATVADCRELDLDILPLMDLWHLVGVCRVEPGRAPVEHFFKLTHEWRIGEQFFVRFAQFEAPKDAAPIEVQVYGLWRNKRSA